MVLSNNKSGWQVVAHHTHDSTSTVRDRIRLGVLLGAGSFGRVYKGRWQGRDVAVKVMQHDAHTAARVANEAALMMSFEHPSIVQAYDFITWAHPIQDQAGEAAQDSKSAGSLLGTAAPSAQPAGRHKAPMQAVAARLLPKQQGDDSAEAVVGRTPFGVRPPDRSAHAGGVCIGSAPHGSEGANLGSGNTPPLQQQQQEQQQCADDPGVLCSGERPNQDDAGGICGEYGPSSNLSYIPVTGRCGAGPPEAAGERPQLLSQASLLSNGPSPPAVPPVILPRRLAAAAAAAAADPDAAQEAASAAQPAGWARSTFGTHWSDASSAPSAEAQTWLVAEFCDAGTLADAAARGRLLGRDGAPSMAKILARLREVASGMLYLHGRSVLHGDLKAANVLLSRQPLAPFGLCCKVSDFGLSRVLNVGATHRSTKTFGTITHMAPELLRLGKMSPAADVYAFGIMMWELYTGETAFGGAHYGEVFERVVLSEDRPPLPDGMPEPYSLLMTTCWRSDPLLRPGFDSVLRCIQLILDEQGVDDEPGQGPRAAAGREGGVGGGAPGSVPPAAPGGPGRTGSLASSYIQDL